MIYIYYIEFIFSTPPKLPNETQEQLNYDNKYSFFSAVKKMYHIIISSFQDEENRHLKTL